MSEGLSIIRERSRRHDWPNRLSCLLDRSFPENKVQQKNDHGGEKGKACPAEREKDGAAVDIL